ncbi:50S ribosomal protein L17 [Candidatus Falkowbacteria bacterium]|nr:50S ribosomal protein L17 [Candidatus Falkowbacteria bacterium]
MRHRDAGKILDRELGPRRALLRGLARSLVLAGKIETTEAKARALRPLIEKQITVGKKATLAGRRQLLAFFGDEVAVNKVLNDLAVKYKERKGGYTRIIKLALRRIGDNAKKAIIEFV